MGALDTLIKNYKARAAKVRKQGRCPSTHITIKCILHEKADIYDKVVRELEDLQLKYLEDLRRML